MYDNLPLSSFPTYTLPDFPIELLREFFVYHTADFQQAVQQFLALDVLDVFDARCSDTPQRISVLSSSKYHENDQPGIDKLPD